MSTNPQQHLTQCEQERLHLSGAVQPHGTLLAADRGKIITHAASNAESYLGVPAKVLLGQPLAPELAALVDTLGAAPGSRRTGALRPLPDSARMQVMVARNDSGESIAELMPLDAADRELQFHAPYFAPASPRNAQEMAAEETAVVQRVAELTGFSRVMYYRFRDDDDGEVIAEACRGDVYGSYLGLRYPASDIPQIARQLYIRNPWRMIPSAAAPPVEIVGATGSTLDLTYSDLRSVSPVHQAYLANMGVVASLSFPLLEGGRLVGLIAAHHNRVQSLPYVVLQQCAARVTQHAETTYMFGVQKRLQLQDDIHKCIQSLRPHFATLDTLEQQWDNVGRQLVDAFQADSVQLQHPRVQLGAGAGLDAPSREVLDTWFSESGVSGVAHCDSLREAGIPLENQQVAGVLGIGAHSRAGRVRLYVTRRELIHDVAWGGRPDKPTESASGGLTIAPRRSFEKWVEKRFGYCQPWGREERMLALSLRALISNTLEAPAGP